MNTMHGCWSAAPTRLGTFHVAELDGFIIQAGLPSGTQAAFLAHLRARYPAAEFRRDDAHPVLRQAAVQLKEYTDGKRKSFDLPLRFEGTAFQLKVWQELARIPFGEVRSYQQVAQRIGRPGASRAVGQANHENPLAPFVPCHRVVTSTGTLGGYGGGMDLKKALLDLEGAHLDDATPARSGAVGAAA